MDEVAIRIALTAAYLCESLQVTAERTPPRLSLTCQRVSATWSLVHEQRCHEPALDTVSIYTSLATCPIKHRQTQHTCSSIP